MYIKKIVTESGGGKYTYVQIREYVPSKIGGMATERIICSLGRLEDVLANREILVNGLNQLKIEIPKKKTR